MEIVCWKCMKRDVTAVGEMCQFCIDKYPRRATVVDMTLEELIETQKKGTVPGDAYRARMEIPFDMSHGGIAGSTPVERNSNPGDSVY